MYLKMFSAKCRSLKFAQASRCDKLLTCCCALPGLVTLDEMRAHQEDVVKARERQIAVNAGQTSHLEVDKNRKKKKGAGSAKQVPLGGWIDMGISLITLHGPFAWGQFHRKC